MFKFLCGVFAAFLLFTLYACLKVGSDADKRFYGDDK